MPDFSIQMIEQIVSGESLLTPSDLVRPSPLRPTRFDQPLSKQILWFTNELSKLRSKFAEKEIELEEVKKTARNQQEKPIKQIQYKANDEI